MGIHFSTIATEQTIAAVATDEAFAKVRLYGLVDFSLSPPWPVDPTAACVDFNDVSSVPPGEFAYPSTDRDITEKHYFWSALCRRVGLSDVQVTVFVCRKVGVGRYRNPVNPIVEEEALPNPVPIKVEVYGNSGDYEITIRGERTFINDGYSVVDNKTGTRYRVLERYADNPDIILLDKPWDRDAKYDYFPPEQQYVWVVPPPVDGGRYPCIAVYQKVIGF